MLVGIVAIPLLIDGMGKDRFGLLGIIWMGVGYFSLFDMGLSRALTKFVAERLGDEGPTENLGSLIWTAIYLILGFGILGCVIVFFGANPLITHVLNVEPKLQGEAIKAFHVLAIGIPVVVITTAMIGILEAHQRFGSIAAVRVPLGVLTFAGPLVTVQFTPSLTWATAAVLLARLMAAVSLFVIASSLRWELKRPQWPSRENIGPLFHFGGWLTVTNIVSPVMDYLDRFLIGSLLTMTAVTYYITPYEVVSRTRRLPQAIMGVLFPAMATAMASDRHRLTVLYQQSSLILFLVMLPVMAAFFLLAPEGLELWLGSQFSESATPVLQWLALGMLVNVLAKPPFTVLQSVGRPDMVAKTHLMELIPYCLMLWGLTSTFGIAGTAAAWAIRALLDAIILNALARHLISEISGAIQRTYLSILIICGLSPLIFFINSLQWRAVLLAGIFSYSLIRGWPILKNFYTNRHRSFSTA